MRNGALVCEQAGSETDGNKLIPRAYLAHRYFSADDFVAEMEVTVDGIDQKYGLGFPLLADEDHAVAEAFGAWGEKSMYGKKYMGIIRSAFLIDETGKVEEAWPKVSPKDTPANLLKTLG